MPSFGVHAAAVTPFAPDGSIDFLGLARLLAWFEACGCRGVVLAGTNGEGPSLAATEKRDLIRAAAPLRGNLEITLGIATPSLTEAIWLSRQAERAGASAVLALPPFYYRAASERGLREWFLRFLDRSSIPVILYNFPRMAGFAFSPELVATLGAHPSTFGLKDSSGERENIVAYRRAMPERKALFVGDESLLIEALEHGWSGAISGASNVLGRWMSAVTEAWMANDRELARTRFEIVRPVIAAVRKGPQPALSKALLSRLRVIDHPEPRPPLEPPPVERVDEVFRILETRLGITADSPGL